MFISGSNAFEIFLKSFWNAFKIAFDNPTQQQIFNCKNNSQAIQQDIGNITEVNL